MTSTEDEYRCNEHYNAQRVNSERPHVYLRLSKDTNDAAEKERYELVALSLTADELNSNDCPEPETFNWMVAEITSLNILRTIWKIAFMINSQFDLYKEELDMKLSWQSIYTHLCCLRFAYTQIGLPPPFNRYLHEIKQFTRDELYQWSSQFPVRCYNRFFFYDDGEEDEEYEEEEEEFFYDDEDNKRIVL